jgi:DNA-directed RNA polymerase specialized sigma24 family protein
LLSEFGHDVCEYIRALVGDDDVKFATLFEDVMVDVLRRIRSGVERKNGDFRRFVFECASQTIRRLHPWVFDSKALGRTTRAPLRDLSRISQPDVGQCKAAVAALSADERELLALRYRFGFSYDDISEIRSEARVNFEDRLQTAREHFRSRMLGLTLGGVHAVSPESDRVQPAGTVARS